jgi:hypothetical protein
MAVEHLPETMKDLGLELLKETDKIGLGAQGAAWVYSHLLREWRYYLVTALVDVMGPKWVYDRLLRVFPKFELPGELSIVDVHLGSPKDALFRRITSIFHIENGVCQFVNCMIDDEEFDSVVYRMHRAPSYERIIKIQSEFDRRVKELATV